MKLINHMEFFRFVLEDAIKLANDREADVFTSWKVGGQDFYAYGRAVEGSVCSACVEAAGTETRRQTPGFDCRPVCAVYRERMDQQKPHPVVTQEMVNAIVARAKRSECGLEETEKGDDSYNIAQYAPHNLHSLAIMLVSAHFSKWDIISIVTAALEEVADRCTNAVGISTQKAIEQANAKEQAQAKTWKDIDWGDECPQCGGGVEILTDAPAGLGCDGDEARCTACGHTGSVSVADIDKAWVVWDQE